MEVFHKTSSYFKLLKISKDIPWIRLTYGGKSARKWNFNFMSG